MEILVVLEKVIYILIAVFLALTGYMLIAYGTRWQSIKGMFSLLAIFLVCIPLIEWAKNDVSLRESAYNEMFTEVVSYGGQTVFYDNETKIMYMRTTGGLFGESQTIMLLDENGEPKLYHSEEDFENEIGEELE